jgi:hypothetical protein
LPIPRFPHRHNPDGSYDSICTKCFATIGANMTEEQLFEAENKHVCNPDVLYEGRVIPINRKEEEKE